MDSRALGLFYERYMDLQGCQLLLKAQTVFLKGLCRVLSEAWETLGGGEWHMRCTVKYGLLTIFFLFLFLSSAEFKA